MLLSCASSAHWHISILAHYNYETVAIKFKLPEEKIALHPTRYRDESRLMVLHRKTGEIEHRMFKDILEYFDDKDVFIFNDTKVFPARLYGNKEKTGARIEVFLLRELNEELRLWDVLVDPPVKSVSATNSIW